MEINYLSSDTDLITDRKKYKISTKIVHKMHSKLNITTLVCSRSTSLLKIVETIYTPCISHINNFAHRTQHAQWKTATVKEVIKK